MLASNPAREREKKLIVEGEYKEKERENRLFSQKNKVDLDGQLCSSIIFVITKLMPFLIFFFLSLDMEVKKYSHHKH